tara:strand:+ start:323 stop:565 length:243 start_codon:yes stop_codon:yes gene_type:complete
MNWQDILKNEPNPKLSPHLESYIQDLEKVGIRLGILKTRNPVPTEEIEELQAEIKRLMEEVQAIAAGEDKFEEQYGEEMA